MSIVCERYVHCDPAMAGDFHRTCRLKSPMVLPSSRCHDERLSTWNQHSPRVYIGLVLCLPFEGSNETRCQAEKHIRESLNRLAIARPDFAGSLEVDRAGFLHLKTCPEQKIPLEIVASRRSPGENDDDYLQHRRAGFPPGLFVGPEHAPSGNPSYSCDGLPVTKVRLKFVRNGLYMMIYLHHSLFDGCSLGIFLDCFAAQTRSSGVQYLNHPSKQLFPCPIINTTASKSISKAREVDAIRHALYNLCIKQCPEYTSLVDNSGPTQPKMDPCAVPISEIQRTGKIFVFKNSQLDRLRDIIKRETGAQERPTSYTVLSALTWAHVVRARIDHEQQYLPTKLPYGQIAAMSPDDSDLSDDGDMVTSIWKSVNWRTRANQTEAEDYFGNAALPAVSQLSQKIVLESCQSAEKLASLVPHIQSTISSVDQKYVDTRQDLFSLASDPRMIGVNYDPREPAMVHFNTWRHFGADVEWDIPGVPVRRAEAIRRLHGGWNLGTALILPSPAGADTQELFVSLSADAMEALCRDQEWLRWADQIIG